MPNDTCLKGAHLVLGGARSGKSSFAEKLLDGSQQPHYIATAEANDEEMATRISHHQHQRGNRWQLFEEPIDLAKAIINTPAHQEILIDCLTLWLSNCLHQQCWQHQKQSFLRALKTRHTNRRATTIMVSNEVGQGIIPMGELSRQFVDEIGWLHQELAQQCEAVTFVVAGLAQKLKGLD